MKKLLCMIMALVILCSFVACGQDAEKKVTIYIPDSITVYDPTGAMAATVTFTYEEGWQTKESFTATMADETGKMGGSATMIYSDKKTVQEITGGAKVETYFDETGKQTKLINRYADGGRREVTYTYDAKGRQTTETEVYYETADAQPTTTVMERTYTETETGSTSTMTVDSRTVVSTYDKNGRMLKQVMTLNGEEMSSTEATYDEAGNMTSQVSYSRGQKNMEMKYTWKAVEVSQETAARLPQMNRAK